MVQIRNDRLRIEADRPLASLTSMGVGGPSQYYTTVETTGELIRALAWANSRSLPIWILSGGSNIIVADEGVVGLVIDVCLRGVRYEAREGAAMLATAAAGEPWDPFVADTVSRGYSGLECLSGIPGRVGATPIQNVGAYGQDVSQSICHVLVLDRASGDIRQVESADCEFGYRTSRFKQLEPDRFVVMAVCYELKLSPPVLSRHAELTRQLANQNANAATVQDVRDAVVSLRKSKSMLLDPADPCTRSCGSFFVNPVISSDRAEALRSRFVGETVPLYPQSAGAVKVAAAWLIEKAGFSRGYNDGSVGLSDKHSLALVARSGARACDVVRFARKIQTTVSDAFDIVLVPEPVFWGYAQMDRGLPAIET
jgi:UDP-N-acetylmuramate dehydrogenase